MKISKQTEHLIKLSFEEDIGTGDLSTDLLVSSTESSEALVTAKETLVLSGIDILQSVFTTLDNNAIITAFAKDGDTVRKGENIAKVNGKTRALLTGERTALNFLQRLSGIATITAKYVTIIKDYKAEVIDTRKTTPCYRELEKYAVTCGGAKNHRFGLYDMVMIKDNHIKGGNGITQCVKKIRGSIPEGIKIEVEIKNETELKEAIECGADVIMLDNMTPADMKRAVKITNGAVILEASGGVTLENIVDIAATGVDLISVGALTHSAGNVDISMNFK